MKKLVLLAVIAAATFSSCQKSNNLAPDTNKIPGGIGAKNRAVLDTDVYVAGNIKAPGFDALDNPVSAAGYWKNGVFNSLPAVSGINTSWAHAVTAVGSNIYIGGYDHGGSQKGIPCYWKNGVEIQLPIPSGGSTGTVTAIAVNGTDVYAVGYYVVNDATHSNRAMLWKNGVAKLLAFNKESSAALGITLDGNDVYICGYANFNSVTCAVYWKNNIWHPFAGTTIPSLAAAIAVDSNHNYYISGTYNKAGCYWKDGNLFTLTGDGYVPYNGYFANNIALSNGSVYVGGSSFCQSCNDNVSSYWKYGQLVQLHDDVATGGVGAIQVVGNDVYVCSANIFTRDQLSFLYSKNGKVTGLPNAYSTGGIAVVVH